MLIAITVRLRVFPLDTRPVFRLRDTFNAVEG
jgi:hypothetical protein